MREPIGEDHDRTANRIGYELKGAQHALRLRMDEALRVHGLTTPQYAAMSVLAERPGISNAQLARRSFLTPQTMNQILGKLGGRGLVERRKHPEHGRVLRAYLTGDGKRLLDDCDEAVAAVEKRMASGLSEEDQRHLLVALRRISGALRNGH